MFKLFILLIFSISFLFSQDFLNHNHEHIGCGKYHSYKAIKNYELLNAQDFPRRNYDILEIEFNVDWTNPLSSIGNTGASRIWTANEVIKLRIDSSNTNKLVFDKVSQRIENLVIRNFSEDYTYSDEDKLTIYFEEYLEVGSELEIEFDFTYLGTGNVGFLLVDKPKAPEKLAYTMSQPYDARHWIVCNDHPYEKQMFKLNLKLPLGFIGASNGLVKNIAEYDDYVEYSWEHEHPIPSYLMVINASKFFRYDYKVPRIENPNDSILLDNYVWQIDYTRDDEDASNFFADKTLNVIPDMTIYFQELFGPYPFEKFGTVTVEDFWAAGMEHQSIQTIRRQLLNGDYPVLVHELGHMWLGDLVTPTSWRDLWMNEGGAQWSEALWEGYLRGEVDGYQYKMIDIKRFYLKNSGALTQDPIYLYDIESTVFGNNRWYIIYQKSSWIYHQLSNFIGKEEFFKILNEYFEEYAYQSIDGETFISFFEERASNPIIPLRKFFDQFLYSAGHPIVNLNYSIAQSESNFEVEINLEQIQERIGSKNLLFLDLYEFPFVIDFYNENQIAYRDTIIMNEKEFLKSYNLDFSPDKIEINENFTFFQLANITSSVNTKNNIEEFSVSPMPIQKEKHFNIKMNININGFYNISLYNIQGQKIENIFSSHLNSGMFELNTKINSELNTGIYFIKLEGPEITSQKIIIE